MAQIVVKKSTGEREPLMIDKIIVALRKAGANNKIAEKIATYIEHRIKKNVTTKTIYKMTLDKLRAEHPAIAARYSLRNAIFKLGPAGFEFEKYIMLLFRAHGYKAHLPEILQGKCITHEVDVLAKKDGKAIMMECKLRHATNIYINIKDTMSTWARFKDLEDGARLKRCPKVDECWLVTNSRFSHDSERFGDCKKMTLLAWDHPSEKPLPAWIDKKKLYPVTVLHSFCRAHLKAFGKAEILLLQDIVEYSIDELKEKTGLPKKQLEPIIKEAKTVLRFNPS